MSQAPALVWFRQDLRLTDNPALEAAMERRAPVIPVFIWAPREEGAWPPGAVSRWWLGRSLAKLSADLEKRGSRLVIRQGPSVEALSRLVAESGATAVFWNRRYEPSAVARDRQVESKLPAGSFNGSLLFEPETILNQSGRPFRIFTAFWRACLARPVARPSPDAPERLPAPAKWPHSLDLSQLGLEPEASRLHEYWQPGEAGARDQWKRFLEEALAGYPVNRDRPGLAGTSRLSPHLHFGEISPRQIWREMRDESPAASQAYLRQIGWREFAYYMLHHHPESPRQPLRQEFAAFPWRMDTKRFQAWKRGRTGYPLVDAGMLELRRTGWMHNRVRMVVASFLVKHLMIGWQDGAAWFWDTLVDADLANNTFGWQWVAGCGADAAPYFRIFSPTLQREKFDPDSAYVRRWLPKQSFSPIVNHHDARAAALKALASIGKR